MRALRPAVTVVLGLGALLAVPAAAEPAATPAAQPVLETGWYPAEGQPGARRYELFLPTAALDDVEEPLPLVVFLHGCTQTAEQGRLASRLTEVAEREGFLALFPEQLRPASGSYPLVDGNGSACWNWFHPDHQVREGGEPATLAGMTRAVSDRFPVDPDRVFVSGVSAGADMATVLAATYPDLYAAVGPVAGCAYRTCSDLDGTAAFAAMGRHERVVPTFVVQATTDLVNNAAMGATALRGWLATNDLADDGETNGSVPQQPTSTTHHDVDPSVVTGEPGDLCLGNHRLPCAAGAGLRSYPYTELRYEQGGRSVVEAWFVHGANHAITGGDPAGTFADPAGPSLAEGMWRFFAAHPRR